MLLFVLTKTLPNAVDRVGQLGGTDAKSILLLGDGVVYGTDPWIDRFRRVGVERVFVARDGLSRLDRDVSPRCEQMDYGDMVTLLMDRARRVLSL